MSLAVAAIAFTTGCAKPSKVVTVKPPPTLKQGYSSLVYFTIESYEDSRMLSKGHTIIYAHFPVGNAVDTQSVMSGQSLQDTTITWSEVKKTTEDSVDIRDSTDVTFCIPESARTDEFRNRVQLTRGSIGAEVHVHLKEHC
jgi:hypothetical protein